MPIHKFSNMIACINRAARAHQVSTLGPNNKLIRKVLLILQRLGYIRGFAILDASTIRVYLKYTEDENAPFRGIFIISKPGNRVYKGYKEWSGRKFFLFSKNLGACQAVLLSTSSGIVTLQEATQLRLGGELLVGVL